MGTKVNTILNVGTEQEIILFSDSTSFNTEDVVTKAIRQKEATLTSVARYLLNFKEYNEIRRQDERFYVDWNPYYDCDYTIDIRSDDNFDLYAEIIKSFYFGVHSINQNLTQFTVDKHIIRTNKSEEIYYELEDIFGRRILDEDMQNVKDIAEELIFDNNNCKEFQSACGDTFNVVKLTKDEYLSFL